MNKPTCEQLIEQLGNNLDITICSDVVYGLGYEYQQLRNEVEKLNNKIEHLKRDKDIMENYLQLILDIGYDYDGCNTVENLKQLIDELCKYALRGRDLDDGEVIFESDNKKYNILNEELKVGNND